MWEVPAFDLKKLEDLPIKLIGDAIALYNPMGGSLHPGKPGRKTTLTEDICQG